MGYLEQFADPPRIFGPIPFWFLNERLDKKRLEWQVCQMHDKHVYAAVMHARPGLITPYLSDEWFDMIGHILSVAEDLGMQMWIYDEYPWHSGMAEWRVPRLHPDFHIRALDHLERIVDGPQRLTWNVTEELPSDAVGIVAVILTSMWQDRLLGAGESVSSAMQNGVLELDLPEGRHHLAVYFEHLSHNPYGDKFGCFPVSDLMHPRAVEAFLELTHYEYQRRFPEHMGSTITAVFTDEPPSATPGWSRVFLSEFVRRKGYDLRPYLGLLWHDGGPMTGKVRLDYYDVVGALYEESFFGQIEEWANKAGIASTGHLLLEETPLFHTRFMGDYFRAMRRLHMPGIDYIFPGRIPPVVPKLAASIANLYDKPRVMSECFALTGWDYSFEHMKWMTDWQLVHGVNLLVPHAFFYAISEEEPIPAVPDNLGFRWFDCPPSMFFQQPYWDYYGVYADYLRRACYLLCQGEHFSQIAIYYPIESVQADFVPTKEYCNLHAFEIPGSWMTADYLWEGRPGVETDAHFRATADGLRLAGLDFDIVDDDSVRTGAVEGASLSVRNRRQYRAIVLPRTQWISVKVYRTIEEFWVGGGAVIATGCPPERAVEGPEQDFEVQEISRRIFASASSEGTEGYSCVLPRPDEQLADILRELDLGDFMSDSPNVFSSHRIMDGADVYFLVHHREHVSTDVRVNLRGQGDPVILDPLSGRMFAADVYERGKDTVGVRLSFEPYESLFVVFDPSREQTKLCKRFSSDDLSAVYTITGPWDVELDFGDRSPQRVQDLPPKPAVTSLSRTHTWQTLAPWEQRGLAEFSGGATFTTRFVWEGSLKEHIFLDLGEVGIAAEVFLNDVYLGTSLWRPHRFAVGASLRPGENELRVRVTNTLANSLQASYGGEDAKTKAGSQRHWASFPAGKLRSGLIGPVRLLAPQTELA